MGWIPKVLKEKYEKKCELCGGKLLLQYDNYGVLYIICTTDGCVREPLGKPYITTNCPPVAQ